MKKIQYSVAMMANPVKPEEAKKAYANLQLTGIVDINDATYLQMYLAEYDVVLGKQPG